MSESTELGDLAHRILRALLNVLLLSLAFMQPAISLLGFAAVATDFIFAGLAVALGALLLVRRARFINDRSYIFIGAYLLALAISVPGSESIRTSLVKLLTQVYLAGLAIVVVNLVQNEAQLRTAIRFWLAGSALVGAAALLALVLFAVSPMSPLLQLALSHKGTLPAGNYPRLNITFLNANMACNYLTVSLMILLAARHVRWVSRPTFLALIGSILVAAAATISPGLGGIALGLGIWCWLTLRGRRGARLSLTAGVVVACLFVLAMAVTPFILPDAPYLVSVPELDLVLAPAGRLLVWTQAAQNFLAHPLTGRGIGVDPVLISYLVPSGELITNTDAHNLFLSIAAQCGLVGLAGLLVLIRHMAQRTGSLSLADRPASVIQVGLGIGLLVALVYEGLGGSFEDARHLWVTFGLLVASNRISTRSSAGARDTRQC